MKNKIKIFTGFLAVFIAVNCSTKKDAFLNRTFHSVSTKYNVLHNGKEALRIGLQQLNDNYDDNYWEQLPIEPLKIDVLALPGMSGEDDSSPREFEKAEEKAVKAIQKHSMLIARRERNKQIDDAYLLLGKSRYYSKRFVPALEAFNFVILNYPNANLIHETRIWQSKTLVRLSNEEQAIDNLKNLLKDVSLEDHIKEDAHTAIAMAYVKADSIVRVKEHLNSATQTAFNKEQTARNLFVLGQLYRVEKQLDSSNIAFQKVVDLKKAPYKYKIHAQIEKAKNVSGKEDVLVTIEELNKLIKDRDNRPYLDELYYQLGMIEKEIDTEEAILYFKKSLSSGKSINYQKELSYEAVGNLYFNKADFIVAGTYYDSVLQIAKNDNTKRIRRLTRKRKNLDEVIFYEHIAKANDSILKIVGMSKEEQKAFYTSFIDKLKADEEKAQQNINTGTSFGNSNRLNKRISDNSGKWYFYNPQTVGFGSQEFRRNWGNRPLEDNWRLSDKTHLNFQGVDVGLTTQNNDIDDSKKYDLDYYLGKIPSERTRIDSIKKERNNAYYKLGVIYKEQFRETNLAIEKLEKLLTFSPVQAISLPAKYHLYKIYSDQNNEKALSLKNDIITNYADSKYAEIIVNPNKLVDEDTSNTPEGAYALLFYDYKDELFDSVIEKAGEAITQYEGLSIVPKFELLKAYALGKRDGIQAFKEALEFVAMNYPNTEEGKKAVEVIETIKTKI